MKYVSFDTTFDRMQIIRVSPDGYLRRDLQDSGDPVSTDVSLVGGDDMMMNRKDKLIYATRLQHVIHSTYGIDICNHSDDELNSLARKLADFASLNVSIEDLTEID